MAFIECEWLRFEIGGASREYRARVSEVGSLFEEKAFAHKFLKFQASPRLHGNFAARQTMLRSLLFEAAFTSPRCASFA